jgi:hypothetical protein
MDQIGRADPAFQDLLLSPSGPPFSSDIGSCQMNDEITVVYEVFIYFLAIGIPVMHPGCGAVPLQHVPAPPAQDGHLISAVLKDPAKPLSDQTRSTRQ